MTRSRRRRRTTEGRRSRTVEFRAVASFAAVRLVAAVVVALLVLAVFDLVGWR